MSLSQMQTAMALLIRLPDHNRDADLIPFLSNFDLTATERLQLATLSADSNVRKYGHSMSNVRWEQIEKDLALTRAILPPALLEEIRREHYEPYASRFRSGDLAIYFFDFLLTDDKVRALIAESGTEFSLDGIAFDRAQAMLRRLARANHAPLPNSMLMHHRFLLSRFDWDVLSLVSGNPVKRPVLLLMLAGKDGGGARFFEVTSEIEEFLLREKNNPGESRAIPKTYGDLVDIGLCRPLH